MKLTNIKTHMADMFIEQCDKAAKTPRGVPSSLIIRPLGARACGPPCPMLHHTAPPIPPDFPLTKWCSRERKAVKAVAARLGLAPTQAFFPQESCHFQQRKMSSESRWWKPPSKWKHWDTAIQIAAILRAANISTAVTPLCVLAGLHNTH